MRSAQTQTSLGFVNTNSRTGKLFELFLQQLEDRVPPAFMINTFLVDATRDVDSAVAQLQPPAAGALACAAAGQSIQSARVAGLARARWLENEIL
uniref:Uncharacterized protein n=1 Tax=Mycena chlorophos TaxID=658473 RepID=A0ABQ0LG04_MYCCL|nr:predicted protein [Mycena chlorophos]